jgi:hypothetical protein
VGAALKQIADDPGADAAVAAGEHDAHKGFPCLAFHPATV